MISTVNWFKCLINQHDLYSECLDLGLEDELLSSTDPYNAVEVNRLVELTSLKCRHCDYKYNYLFKTNNK